MPRLPQLARRPSPSMVVALLALLVGGAGVVSAAVPDAGGAIHGCYSTRTGVLRIIDTEATPPGTCTSKETAISWNEQGVPGAPGAPGASGAPGQDGSISGTYVRHAVASSGANTVTVTCDAGDVVTGGGANSDGTLVDVYPYTAGFPDPPSDVPLGYAATKSGGTQLVAYVICVDVTP